MIKYKLKRLVAGSVNETLLNAKVINDIAKKHLDIKTLKRRNSDSLDFHDVAVWSLRDALDDAYKKGYAAGLKAK